MEHPEFTYRTMTFAGGEVPALAGYSLGTRSQWRYGTRTEEVLLNYRAVAQALGVDEARMVMPMETHTSTVATVTARDGGGGVIRDIELHDVDGLVTAERGLLLCLTICDCVPVFLCDEAGRAASVLHCGWRGTRGGIVAEGVRRMVGLGAEPARIHAVIGPHICARCFEVGEELKGEFAAIHTPEELANLFAIRDGRLTLDLTESLRIQLVRSGLLPQNVAASDECTYHGDSFFSYRRGDCDRRNLAFAMLI